MSRLATAFVLGYHGCDSALANRAVLGQVDLLHSNQKFDWLGPGAYFWESDPQRALEWAQDRVAKGIYTKAAVIGAVIDLGNCLDLQSRSDVELLKFAHKSFCNGQKKAGLPLPTNRGIKGKPDHDRVLRFLDCAVIRHLHDIIEESPSEGRDIPPFDTVRGMFTEGKYAYPGCGFKERTHVQIAVRNNDCIKGLFFPHPNPA